MANGRETMARGYARAREKDEAARAALVPIAPGERPWPIALSAILAALFAVANLVLVAVGWEVDGKRPIAGGLVFAGVMLAAAVGMWYLRYWAVLGFEVLLGVTFIGAMLSLLRRGQFPGRAAGRRRDGAHRAAVLAADPADGADPDAGAQVSWAYTHTEHIRFGDLDAMRHLNNVVFLRYFESARIAYLNARAWISTIR